VSRKDRSLRRDALEASTSERLAAIVAAAEQAAAKVIDDAEAEGQRYLSDARVEADRIVAERLSSFATLTDALAAQAETIRLQSERLLKALADARAELGVDQDAAPASRSSHLSAVAPVEAPADEQPTMSPVTDLENNAGARLLATQMAVSGSSREEIALRLRNGFEIDDTEAILDAILGPED
jgi:vacuolar-type H+-ATPase subunit H